MDWWRRWRRSAPAPGRGVGLHVDLNFNFKTEGYIRLAQALEPFDLVWLEIDSYDPAALATIRRSARTRVASLELLYGRRQFRPFFEQQAVDVAIIDVAWNGILESMKIAAMADAYEINVAPHNFNGHIGSLMSAHMCAAIPNFRVMEIDIEDVPWKDDLVTAPPRIENGRTADPHRRRLGRGGERGGDPRASATPSEEVATVEGSLGGLWREPGIVVPHDPPPALRPGPTARAATTRIGKRPAPPTTRTGKRLLTGRAASRTTASWPAPEPAICPRQTMQARGNPTRSSPGRWPARGPAMTRLYVPITTPL